MGEAVQPLTYQQQVRSRWRQKACLPAKPFTVDPALPPAATQWLRGFCDGTLADPGQGVALTGDPGTGKTTMAVHMAAYVTQHATREALGYDTEVGALPKRPVYFSAYYDFVRDQKLLWKMEREGLSQTDEYGLVEERVLAVNLEWPDPRWWAKLVVLDDVGKEYRSGSGWAETELNGLLRLRHRHQCATVVTSNFPLSAWSDVYGEALGSFAREAFIEVPVGGVDRR